MICSNAPRRSERSHDALNSDGAHGRSEYGMQLRRLLPVERRRRAPWRNTPGTKHDHRGDTAYRRCTHHGARQEVGPARRTDWPPLSDKGVIGGNALRRDEIDEDPLTRTLGDHTASTPSTKARGKCGRNLDFTCDLADSHHPP